jgi:serine/threonine protein kinase
VVFAAQDDEGPEDAPWDFALKRLQKEWRDVEEARKRFKRETDIQSELDHPNVVPVVDAGESARWGPWFVMPRATDGSLKDAIDDGRAADHDWALTVFEGVLAGVAHAHEQQVFHRDIKPSNVLLFSGEPRIADFGIARQIDVQGTTLTHTAEQLGTFLYMAPEQFHDVKKAGPPADVYSLGKVLCHLLSGIQPKTLKVDLHGIPSEYRVFIDKCCREDPSERFQTAGEALERFRRSATPVKVVLPPLEQGQELVDQAEAALDSDAEQESIEALNAHFQSYAAERDLYMQVLPRISAELTNAWINQSEDGFHQTIGHYDQMIEESNLNFGYCDVIARFYRRIFRATENVGLKRLVASRLIVMGHHYNRFFVHDVVVDLLPTLQDACDIEIVEEVIQEHSEAASWYAASALRTSLPAPIAEALRSIRPEL